MANTTKSTKKATVATLPTFEFRGIVRSFIAKDDVRIVKFDTLNKTKTKTVQFYAQLTDKEVYLASYIKSKAVVSVKVQELEPVEGKRRFEIISMMSELDRTNFNILLEDSKPKA